MADNDNKNIDFKSSKDKLEKAGDAKDSRQKKTHSRKSFAWWAGVIVLILISITFILPATGVTSLFMDSSLEFGRYNGESISYENGSYMYNQFYNLYMQYGGSMDQYSILSQAYYNTVMNVALTQKAEAAGLYVSEEMINAGIINSGYYNNDSGVFDESLYQAAGVSERTSVYNSVRDMLPASTVINDVSTVRSSDAEKAFVSSMASHGRTFDYAAFNYENYPAESVAQYVNSNPQPFMQLALTSLSFTTQQEAQSAVDEAAADPASFDAKAEEMSASSQNVLLYSLENAVGQESANAVFSAQEGSILGPYASGSSYLVCRVDGTPAMADLADEETAASVRSYINANDAALITDWAAAEADRFYQEAQTDFDAAVQDFGITVTNVGFTPVSNNSSMILSGLSSTDPNGLLSSAANSDSAYEASLFSSAEGTVLAPVSVQNGVIVTRVNAETEDTANSSFVETFYDYASGSLAQSDLQSAVLTSPDFEDNFYTVLLERIIGAQQ